MTQVEFERLVNEGWSAPHIAKFASRDPTWVYARCREIGRPLLRNDVREFLERGGAMVRDLLPNGAWRWCDAQRSSVVDVNSIGDPSSIACLSAMVASGRLIERDGRSGVYFLVKD